MKGGGEDGTQFGKGNNDGISDESGRIVPGGQPVRGGWSLPVQEGNALQLDMDVVQTLKQKDPLRFTGK